MNHTIPQSFWRPSGLRTVEIIRQDPAATPPAKLIKSCPCHSLRLQIRYSILQSPAFTARAASLFSHQASLHALRRVNF